MVSLLAVSVLAALPTLRPLQPPLALFTVEVLQDASSASPQNGDEFLRYQSEQCPGRAVSLMRAMGAGLTTLERMQTWLKENPGVEAVLFKKDTLGKVAKHSSTAVPGSAYACAAWSGEPSWQYPPTPPGKICFSKKPPATNERWLTQKQKAAAAVKVEPATDPCQPRVSIALFDPNGKTRLVLNADFGGVMSASLIGDACRVDFTWDPTIEAFKPEWKSCKG